MIYSQQSNRNSLTSTSSGALALPGISQTGSYDPIDGHPVETYAWLYCAFDFFNRELFDGKLPPCLITMQPHKGAYGYFSAGRFGNVGTRDDVRDEIALNPQHFANRPVRETLSTLVHEATHVLQHHFGRPGRSGYHNRQWAGIMRAVGLIPSNTGKPGGGETGDRVSHYILDGGPFDEAFNAFTKANSAVLYQDLAYTGEGQAARKRLKKSASKTKFSCTGCGEEHAWAKPSARLICGGCGSRMEADCSFHSSLSENKARTGPVG